MTEMLTEQEIEDLLNDVASVYTDHPTCPKCQKKTKRVLIKQKYTQPTYIEVVNEQDYKKYTGLVYKNMCICLQCGTNYQSN